jgi:molybdopterin/thiamine biosynthesis adenylyltransferase
VSALWRRRRTTLNTHRLRRRPGRPRHPPGRRLGHPLVRRLGHPLGPRLGHPLVRRTHRSRRITGPSADRVPVEPWWERYPGRFEHEIALLEAAGFAPVVDETAKSSGLARLTVTVPVGDLGPVEMRATYPDLYPYFRPEVAASGLDLPHHQHPFSKNLCLIGRATGNWGPEDTLADLLTQQVPLTVAAGTADPPAGPERDALPEEQQAEPYSDYYQYAPNVMMLIDGGWTIPHDETCGSMTMRVRGSGLPPSDDLDTHTLAVVTEVRGEHGTVVATAPESLIKFFPGEIAARWSRLSAAVASNNPADLWAAAENADPGGDPPTVRFGPSTAPPVQVRAVLFPEETGWRESGHGWLFVVRQPGRVRQAKQSKKRNLPATSYTTSDRHWLVRAGRAGPGDLAARTPELVGLRSRRAVVVGAGALGATIAIQLARAGIGTLVTIDRDTLDPGNTVRHAVSFLQSGRLKAAATAATAVDHSPYVISQFNPLTIGTVRDEPTGMTDAEALDDALSNTDLVIDATAEIGIQHMLADEARRRRLPYLCVTATNGAWGGMVTLVTPDGTDGCWFCLLKHMDDRTIPTPPAAPSEFVQPPGCASPTFTGAGFDLDHISLHAVRVATAALLADTLGAYPTPPHDVAVLALREHDGTPSLPTWTGYALSRHPDCPCH